MVTTEFVGLKAAGWLDWEGRSRIESSADGVIKLSNNAETDFSLLQFGGITASEPALKRNGAALEVKLADDSAYTVLAASRVTLGSGGAPTAALVTGQRWRLSSDGTSGNLTISNESATASGVGVTFGDTTIYRGGDGILEQSNSTTAQEFRLFNTTDGSAGSHTNYEYAGLWWAGSEFHIGAEYGGGSGAARNITFRTGNVDRWKLELGGSYRPATDNLYDAGTATHQIRTGYFGTSILLNSEKVIAEEHFVIPVGDETTSITTGTAKAKFRMPLYATLKEVRASLSNASNSGNVVIDVNRDGASIFGTKLTIDQDETTSTTSATPATIPDPEVLDDGELVIDIDSAGASAKGLKLSFIVVPSLSIPYEGPLDVYSTNIWGAYSIARKLESTWSGNLIRIREDGGDTETDIGLAGNYLDTAAIASHCGANNGFVVKVYDQSGNANDLSQATASLQMKIYNGTSVITNADGFPSMHNPGWGTTQRVHLKSAQDTGLVQPATVFYVSEDIQQVNGECRFDGAPTSGFGCLSQQPVDDVNNRYAKCYAGAHLLDSGNTNSIVEADPFIMICGFDNTSSVLKANDDADKTGTTGTNSFHGLTWGGFSSGPGNSNAECYHTEILVYNELVSGANRDSIRGNLNGYYATY